MAHFDNIKDLSTNEMNNATLLTEDITIKDWIIYKSKYKTSFYRYDNWTIDEFDWIWKYCNTKFA